MLTTILQLILKEIANNSTPNCTQQAVVLLMSEIISRSPTGK